MKIGDNVQFGAGQGNYASMIGTVKAIEPIDRVTVMIDRPFASEDPDQIGKDELYTDHWTLPTCIRVISQDEFTAIHNENEREYHERIEWRKKLQNA